MPVALANPYLLHRDHDYNNQTGEFALLNEVLKRLSFLPARRDDENILVTEGDMIRQRQTNYVEYLVTRGKGKNGMTQEERAESDRLIREVETAVASKSLHIISPPPLSPPYNPIPRPIAHSRYRAHN